MRPGVDCLRVLLLISVTGVFINISTAQDVTVTIVSNPTGTPVSGSTNTFDYPILSSVTLTCMVTSSDGSTPTVTNYQWDTTRCYTNPAHNSGNPTCFPTGQTTQSVTGNDLTAEDAGTITCTVTIDGVDNTSEPLTLRISGIAVTGVLIGNSDIVTGNLLTDYSSITGTDNGLVARCVSGLGPTGTDDNTDLGIWYFNGAQLPYGLCEDPVVNVIQSRIAGLMNFIGVINLWQCEPTLNITAEGIYTCVIMDSSMMNQTRRLGVYFSGRTAPMIDPPSSSTVAVAAGSPLTLSCTSRGSPPDTFTWGKDSGPIVQSTSITTVTHNSTSAVFRANYSINSVNTSDSGTYTCTVTNPIGSDSEIINVTVIDPIPPAVSISPSGPIQGAMVGDPLTIQCIANTTVMLDETLVVFNWMRPGEDAITNNSRVTISSTTFSGNSYISSIQFTYLMEGDNGTYTCSVSILTSSESELIVLATLTVPIPNVTVTAPNTQSVGQSLTLECNVTTVRGITSRVDIIWSTGGRELDEMRAVSPIGNSAVYTSTYTIPQLNTTDNHREYHCEVMINSHPAVLTYNRVILDLMVPPFNITILPNGTMQSAIVGDALYLNCVVSTVSGVESSSVMISWMGPRGDTATDDSRVTINPTTLNGSNYISSLQFTYLMEGDEGAYLCNVSILNAGESELVMLEALTVPFPNVTVTAPNTQTVGQSLTLECSVTTVRGITSRVDIIWSSNGTQLERTEGVSVSSTTDNSVVYTDTYIISQLNTTDDGREYQCEVVINTSPPVMANDSVTLDVMENTFASSVTISSDDVNTIMTFTSLVTPTVVTSSSSVESTGTTTITPTTTTTNNNNTTKGSESDDFEIGEGLGILVIAIGSLLVIAFLIALFLMVAAVWRHTKRKSSKPTSGKVSPTNDNGDYTPVEMSESVPTNPKDETTTFHPKTGVVEPLTIDQLHESIKGLSKLYNEFESIPQLIITEAAYVGIQAKNRLGGYLPTPDSRVVLLSSVPESTYINANYIEGYKGAEKYYIATQAPLHNTINDFWQMVWEQKPALIVMIEEINETIVYWPDTNELLHQEYGPVTVTVRLRVSKPDYTITTFRVSHTAEGKYMDIEHHWYKKWGTYQLPQDTNGVITFLQDVNEAKKSRPGPVMVHCSDGLGRSGALIAFDIARQQLENEHQVDVVDIVTNLREDRGGMISTKEQYAFVYQILSDWAKNLPTKEPSVDTE
ncbi:uncharacterized protein [Dysidea avara]|uniref:uncharacterized protein isoform X2 n=1 Tax=Dysidea avara TaxID=196820 RepID=UPI00332225DF